MLEDFNEQEGARYIASAEVDADLMVDEQANMDTTPVPCPGCSAPLVGIEYPTCSTCRIALSVSAMVLADSYQEWFAGHAATGCDWPPDVSVVPTPNNTGQVQIRCDGCSRADIIPHLIVKRF